MNVANKVLVLGDPGVGKTTFVNAVCNDRDKPVISTVGCNIEVTEHSYAAGTPRETNEVIELWDVGGANVHRRAAREVFMEDVCGVIFIHDLSNKKSEENLLQWANLLYEPPQLDRKKQTNPLQPIAFAADFESNQHLPTLIVGSHFDLYPNRGHNDAKLAKLRLQSQTLGINVDCRNGLLPGSTERMQLNKFFDMVVDRSHSGKDANLGTYGSYHRRRRPA